MKIYCSGKARIRHSESGEVFEIDSSELDWYSADGDDRAMGLEIHYEAVFEHPELGPLIWGLWEYPIGMENYQNTDVGSHEVIEDFTYGLEHEEEPDEWLDYSVPDDPFSIFMNSYHHTCDLLEELGTDDGASILNRMVFSHQVTALEAYLGDTLINAVVGDADAMQRLITEDDELAKEKFKLSQITKEPTLIERKVREHLRSILYHNLAKVDVLYGIALKIKILDHSDDKGSLFKAVILRHDCVHRNGFDKEGNELKIFNKKFVRDSADQIKSFVENIENALQARSRNFF